MRSYETAALRVTRSPHTGHLQERCARCGKVAYTAERAREVAALVSERQPMQAYFDARCGHWHLTRGLKVRRPKTVRDYGNW